MKNILLILITLILFSGSLIGNVNGIEGSIILNTNTEVSIDNIKEEISEGTLLVAEWKSEIKSIKKDGFSLQMIISLAILLLSTVIFLGVCSVILLNIVQFFTPDRIDEKIEVIEEWITKNIIKLPIRLIANLRKIVKKKS